MKHAILFILISIIYVGTLSATGPSSIYSVLTPIAINSKGDVLCKTKYKENQTGGYGYMDVYYGLCVLTKKSIVEYPIFKLDAETYDKMEVDPEDGASDKYWALHDKWDDWFDNKTDRKTPEETKLIEKYSFNDFDMSKYLVADTISIDVFKEKYKTNLSSNKLRTLRKAHSLPPDEYTENMIVSYVFDNKIICRSIFDELHYGPNYDFKTIYFGGIGYDYYFIDGVLFK